MKLSHYISVLILCCMSFGLISSGIIFYNSQKIDKSQLTLQRLTQDQAKCKNIDLILSQWLTMLDLYLINKQTYLYEGIKDESDILIDLTRGIQQDLDDKHVESLKNFRNKIRNVQQIVNECQNASINTNPGLWEQSLEKTDLITENIDEAIKSTSINFNQLIDRTNLDIEKQRTVLDFTAYGILILVALITVASLRYSRKSIIDPLERLSDIAEKENLHPKDFRLKGPKEVKVLSKKLGNYILALMKAREVAMSESQLTKYANARIRNIMETAGDAIICSDEKGNIIEMNQSFRKLSAININKYPAPTLNELIPELDLNQFEEIDHCELISVIDTTLYSKDKREIPVEISTSCFSSKTGRLYTIIIRDISERKELLEQLLNAQKLESIGRLAAGIAHEINTPAQYIMDYNRFIKDGFGQLSELIKKAHALNIPELEDFTEENQLSFYEEEIPNAIQGSLFGLEQISRIVKSVKGFMHPQQADKTLYNVNNIIKDTINVSRNEWKYDADIETNLDDNLPDSYCFPVRLNQVFLNLIVNAAQAINEKNSSIENSQKGKITISTENKSDSVIIKITDSGNGISESDKNKVFDPFFTTKEVGVGTGQGLALSYDYIVNKHAGEIKFDSTPGMGTEFTISLPLIDNIAKAV